MLNWCRLIIWFHDHLPFMIIYCPTVSITWRLLKLCENGSNIDYMYEISSVWEKPWKPKFRVRPFDFGSVRVLKTETKPKFGFRTSLMKMLTKTDSSAVQFTSCLTWLMSVNCCFIVNFLISNNVLIRTLMCVTGVYYD